MGRVTSVSKTSVLPTDAVNASFRVRNCLFVMGYCPRYIARMTDNPVGQRIQILLDERRLTRRDLSRGSGVDYHRLTMLFRRPSAKPNAEDLIALADHLEVSQAYLLFGSDRPTALEALRDQVAREISLLSEKELRSLLIGLKSLRAPERNKAD